MQNKAVLIYSGYNDRAVIAWIRFFSQQNIPFFIIARDDFDYIHLTPYKRYIVKVRKTKKLSISELIEVRDKINNTHPSSFSSFLLLPSSEYLNRFFLQFQSELKLENIEIPLVNVKIYEKISDKFFFWELCRAENIPVPREYAFESVMDFPVVIKPRRYFGANHRVYSKPVMVHDRKKLKEFFEKNNPEEFYIEQFVAGKSYYLLMYMMKNGEALIYSQENLLQQSDGRSIVGAVSSDIHHHEIANLYTNLLRKLNFHGLIMIEIRLSNDTFYMIEANPRIWGPSQLILDSGMLIMDYFAMENGLQSTISSQKLYIPGTKYFWMGGLLEDLRLGKRITFYNYDEIKFFQEYHHWMTSDIYFRKDTLQIFLKESGWINETETIHS